MAGKNDIPGLRRDLAAFHKDMPTVLRRIAGAASKMIADTATGRYMRFVSAPAGRRSPTDTGPLRIASGRLARSLTGAQTLGSRESIYKVHLKGLRLELTMGSLVPYAAVHEFGFSGSVTVQAHTRQVTQVFGHVLPHPVEVAVSTHTRQANIPARPYLEPSLRHNESKITKHAAGKVYDAFKEAI